MAGSIVARELGLPHVVRTAGSDIGRLFDHFQLGPVYGRILRAAEAVITGPSLRAKIADAGVNQGRIQHDPGLAASPEMFDPVGDVLDLSSLIAEMAADSGYKPSIRGNYDQGLRYIGVYGKLGVAKGSFALLDAMQTVVSRNPGTGLLVMGHGWPEVEREFHARIGGLHLEDHVLQIPFLPPWRVPEFLRRCDAVCALEQDFPIRHHAPVVPREILLSGKCVVASSEMLEKFPASERMISGYNCLRIDDVHEVSTLSEALAGVVANPDIAGDIGKRGRDCALELSRLDPGVSRLEEILQDASSNGSRRAGGQAVRSRRTAERGSGLDLSPQRDDATGGPMSVEDLGCLLGAGLGGGHAPSMVLPDRMLQKKTAAAETPRLRIAGWGIGESALLELVPERCQDLAITQFDQDLNRALDAATGTGSAVGVSEGPSFLVFRNAVRAIRAVVLSCREHDWLLACNGRRSIGELAGGSREVRDLLERLFLLDLVTLRDPSVR